MLLLADSGIYQGKWYGIQGITTHQCSDLEVINLGETNFIHGVIDTDNKFYVKMEKKCQDVLLLSYDWNEIAMIIPLIFSKNPNLNEQM